jgi:hypothetical protein
MPKLERNIWYWVKSVKMSKNRLNMPRDHLSSQFSRGSNRNMSRRYALKEDHTRLTDRCAIIVYKKQQNDNTTRHGKTLREESTNSFQKSWLETGQFPNGSERYWTIKYRQGSRYQLLSMLWFATLFYLGKFGQSIIDSSRKIQK